MRFSAVAPEFAVSTRLRSLLVYKAAKSCPLNASRLADKWQKSFSLLFWLFPALVDFTCM